ncbi:MULTISPECIES: triphosphoribosyl-dephospho-CoA synthase [Cupriavidus]|uniref:Probable 2-(5''-triphosphoribosyl)-3'-dephosphocoenzyme-A synthase n=1 Tax=Cupriavidus metallidurans TaxID=119219 RepID=A0A482J009_9BURK|nr:MULTISPECIES: triphosphoribosyl-dephospho-CoA synthase [Cupriavidus]MWL91920.1 triphosphoribosyl-dephospho-CoA synthase [Cupriavidus sp. SW-Y-13]QBP14568.1 triphosphoribosyl-dephospho-CoA synthase [Cupriavidus metallidurans]
MRALATLTRSDSLAHDSAGAIGDIAVAVLIEEAMLAPKPGLVDARGNGAHADMSLRLMIDSAHSLRDSFVAMAQAGQRAMRIDQTLRERLGSLGREAENAMLDATGGVNTHRGAIWALGLLAAATGWLGKSRNANAIAQIAGVIARLTDRRRPTHTGNKGELARHAYDVGGARAQAEACFPHVIGIGLPTLHAARLRGDAESAARVNALLAIMAQLDDTCVLARAGCEGLAEMQAGAEAVLEAGGIGTLAGRRRLHELEATMRIGNMSPGGAADLLAATLFLDRLPH